MTRPKLSGEAQPLQAGEAPTPLPEGASDLSATLQGTLRSVLETAGRSSGMLLMFLPGDGEAELLISQNAPEVWLAQIHDADSALRELAQRVLRSEEPFISDGALDDLAAVLPIHDPSGIHALLFLGGKRPPSAEMQRLESVLTALGSAILLSRALFSAQRRWRELANLQTSLARLALSGDLDALQAHLIRETCRLMDSEAATLSLIDETNEEWIIQHWLSKDQEWFYRIFPKEGDGLIRACLRTGRPIGLNEVSAQTGLDPESDVPAGFSVHSMLCHPLVSEGQTRGVIQVLNNRPGAFEVADQELLSAIAALGVSAGRSARTLQQLKVANADLQASRWELLGSRNTLRALFDNLPAALYIIDRDYRIAATNLGRAQRAGKTPQTLVGQLCYQALFNREERCAECRIHETLQEGQRTQRSERRTTAGDDYAEWEISTYPILDEENQVTQAIQLEEDVTEKRHLEAILTQSEKLAAVGQLAAGVAHEINNPLTAIIANAQILHRELPPNHDLQESVDLIARAGARAHQVVRNLLDFARKEDYHLSLTDLNETMERALELVQHELLARGVRLEFQPEPSLPPLLASHDHLQSVWLNLLLNAIDSLDKSPAEIKIATRRVGEEIEVAVADNGKGIPAERLTRIFEPFYTTKAPGRGTGLGLSVTHRIIKQHGGHIRVESQPGMGSTFTVIFPLS
jgi:two-component system NtrC family sensor kinase